MESGRNSYVERNRIRDFGIVPGRLETGKRNKITDVPGVKVGHCTVKTEENHTGITVIVPGADNAFAQSTRLLPMSIMGLARAPAWYRWKSLVPWKHPLP